MASLVGRTIGNIEILEHINHGSMATVYKGRQLRLGRSVAIKALHPHLVADADLLARFEREAQAVTRLRHRNIVQVFDFDAVEEEDLYYMVVEYIDGGSLKDTLDHLHQLGERMPINTAAAIFADVADALAYAHQMGILHRDVKPGNIMLDRSGRACLTDFGIAQVAGSRHLTAAGTLIGTPIYMSPEQCQGFEITHASDIYSLGVVLYEMLSGQAPFESNSMLDLVHAHVHTPVPPLGLPAQRASQGLESVIQKALAKQPRERFKDVPALRAAALAAMGKPSAGIAVQTHVHSAAKIPPPDPAVSPSKAVTEIWQPDSEEQPENLASQSTEVWQPDTGVEPKGLASQPTEVWQPENQSGHRDKTRIAEVTRRVERRRPAGLAPLKPVSGSETQASDRIPPVWSNKGRRRWVFIVAGLLLATIAAVAAVVAFNLIGSPFSQAGSSCDSPDSCRLEAEQYWQNNDFETAIDFINQAIFFAETQEHPPSADLWCWRGEAHEALGVIDEAIVSYENCINWTEDDPGLEDVRIFASEKINMLSGQ
jgi:serine/threonine protein kinase